MSLLISLLALFATFFELYLQRRHNEKSLKPIPQIVFEDTQKRLFVYLQNNGVGPLIVNQLLFTKDGVDYSGIECCLSLDPKSYMHGTEISTETPKVILPGSFIEVFGMILEEHEGEEQLVKARSELSVLHLKVSAQDTYNRTHKANRSLRWFMRHYQTEKLGCKPWKQTI